MLDVRVSTIRYLDADVHEGSLPREVYDNAVTELHENLEIHEAIDLIRRLGLRFDATNNDWACNPDGAVVVDYATGEYEEVTAHPVVETAHDWELAAVMAGVDGQCERCLPGRHH